MKIVEPYTLSNITCSGLIKPESGINNFVETSKTLKLETDSNHPAGVQIPQLTGRIFMCCLLPIFTTLGMIYNLVNFTWKGVLLLGLTFTGKELKHITKAQLGNDISRHAALFGIDYVSSVLYGLSLPVIVVTYCVAPDFFRECSDKLHKKVFSVLKVATDYDSEELSFLSILPKAFSEVFRG